MIRAHADRLPPMECTATIHMPERGKPHGVAIGVDGTIHVSNPDKNCMHTIHAHGCSITTWSAIERMRLSQPHGVAVKTDGTILVVDNDRHHIRTCNRDCADLGTWGQLGNRASQLYAPRGVAVAPDDSVYVADTKNHRIQRFTPSGLARLRSLGKHGTKNGTEHGSFCYPRGVAVGADGTVFVADTNNHRIQAFREDGALITVWGTEGCDEGSCFLYPNGVAVGPDGTVFVADTYNDRVQAFEPNGTHLFTLSGAGDGDPFDLPRGVAVGRDGMVVVADTGNSRIVKFRSGRAAPGELTKPCRPSRSVDAA